MVARNFFSGAAIFGWSDWPTAPQRPVQSPRMLRLIGADLGRYIIVWPHL